MEMKLDDLAILILQDPKPVVFFDTCSLLDIVRSVERDNIAPEIVPSAIELSSSHDRWLLTSNVVNEEWKKHIEEVELGTYRALKNLHKKVVMFKESVGKTPTISNWTYSSDIVSYRLEETLKSVSANLVNALTIIEQDVECMEKACNRLVQCMPPASKGKDEFKDCFILEKCLKIAGLLKSRGFSEPIVFVSSNKADFGIPFNTNEPLHSEFSNVSVQYVGDLPNAARLTRKSL